MRRVGGPEAGVTIGPVRATVTFSGLAPVPAGVSDTGTYALVIGLSEAATVEFGAAGPRDLEAGWYAYAGSALGSGGFARVDRHRRLAAGESDTRHWHVDYLLGHPAASVEDAVEMPDVDVECEVGAAVRGAGDPVPGVGATDCQCSTHLAYSPDRESLVAALDRARENALDDR